MNTLKVPFQALPNKCKKEVALFYTGVFGLIVNEWEEQNSALLQILQ